MKKFLDWIDAAADGYEPALVTSIVTAIFTLAAGLGLTVGDLPAKANVVLTFLAFIAPIIGGAITRSKVTPTKRLGGE